MKILFLTHRLPYAPNRGDRIRAYHVLQHLSRHASVDLLSLIHDQAEAQQVNEVPARRVVAISTTPWRNRIRAAGSLLSRVPMTHMLLDSPALKDALDDLVQEGKPDVILAYCSGIARLALTDSMRHIPLVLDMVDVDSAKWLALSKSTPPPMGWVYRREAHCLGRFESRIVAHARTTLVVNEREHRTLTAIAPGADVKTVPNGIDLEGFRSRQHASSTAAVIFCGVLDYQPNEEAVLRLVRCIWPRVRAGYPDARLTIVGANPTTRLRQAVAGESSIDVTGSVPDVRPYLWSSAVSVAPLITARGLQNKVLEALAAGLPVVTTPTVAEGLPASTLPGCLVANDDADIASAVVALLRKSPDERKAFAAAAQLSDLGWGRQLAALLPILTAATERRPGTRLAS